MEKTMLDQLLERFHLWRLQRIAVHKLRALDDHLLCDLGVSRETIEDFVRHCRH